MGRREWINRNSSVCLVGHVNNGRQLGPIMKYFGARGECLTFLLVAWTMDGAQLDGVISVSPTAQKVPIKV